MVGAVISDFTWGKCVRPFWSLSFILILIMHYIFVLRVINDGQSETSRIRATDDPVATVKLTP